MYIMYIEICVYIHASMCRSIYHISSCEVVGRPILGRPSPFNMTIPNQDKWRQMHTATCTLTRRDLKIF